MFRLPAVAVLFALSGCVQARVDAPSLLPRAIETRDLAEPDPAPSVGIDDPAFEAEVAAHSKAFDEASVGFASALTAAEPRIRRAARAAPASDVWLDAQAALTEIGSARALTDAALADLEGLAIRRAEANRPPQPVLDAKIVSANAELERQAAAVERLTAIVPQIEASDGVS